MVCLLLYGLVSNGDGQDYNTCNSVAINNRNYFKGGQDFLFSGLIAAQNEIHCQVSKIIVRQFPLFNHI